jgi:DNA repair exonuclease SbcCD nuclease subunit
MVRFLHTADWQLGMTRHFLDAEAQGRFSQARIDAIQRLADVAAAHDCAFVVVAGDVFETNQPDRTTLGRALDALQAFTVPVYLLPGNHDVYDPGSVYRQRSFLDRCPAGVEVLADRRPRTPCHGVQVVGAPWTSKHPLTDLVAETCAQQPADGAVRVVVGHGTADVLSGDFDQPGTFRLADVDPSIATGKVSFLALGDRHSTSSVGASGRIWFSGSPEPTAYTEDDPGNALVVDLDDDPPRVQKIPVGTWAFHVIARSVDGDDDLDHLLADLDAVPERSRAIVKLKIDGTLTLTQAARLERELDAREDVFGALEHPERHRDIVIAPDTADVQALPLGGYAAVARDRLLDRSGGDGDEALAATDALGLLVRLSAEVDA